ncbi:MAG TPA: FapA family protein, partial [Lachnospiraceae bacterium]|nr:FapA family protein [Lachnospiraceae bacterium]
MGKKNGYFQLLMKSDGAYVRLFPQKEGGEPISLDECKEYLALKGYKPDAVVLNKTLMRLEQPEDVKIDDKANSAESEMLVLKVSENKMKASIRFYPPSSGGAVLSGEAILSDIRQKGIQFGIREDVISSYLADRCYCMDYLIAEGKLPRQGTDAQIEYLFNTNPNTKPTLNSDGTVDFFNLNIISKCTVGQVLARLIREDRGDDGQNVFGERVSPRDVRRLSLKYGRNIALSDDDLSISSKINGHVSLVDDKVFVTDVYEVNDVDTSTGNIDYKGNVLVLGNVKAGFSVISEGNIEVRGVVEGALLDAGGDIIIIRGMNGMGRGKLRAGGNIVAKFIENADVSAGGYVQTEALLHSKVSAKGDIEVNGKKGFIAGGVIRSRGTVSARVVGSTMGVDT